MGGEGEGKGPVTGGVQVAVPEEEEKMAIRYLGSEEKKEYLNQPGSKSRTELGSGDFEKPKAEVDKKAQPIPVEYQELLRE